MHYVYCLEGLNFAYVYIMSSPVGKKYIGRSAVRDVAELRMPYLDEFLKVSSDGEKRERGREGRGGREWEMFWLVGYSVGLPVGVLSLQC